MAISPRLEIKQSQSLLMTQQLRQAINLLQLNNLELNEIIEQELEGNPLLEREDEHLNSLPEDNLPSIDDNQLPVDNTAEEFVPDIDFSQTFGVANAIPICSYICRYSDFEELILC